MSNGVRAEYRYDGLILVCEPDTIVRLHGLLRAELAMDAPIPDETAVRYIAIRSDAPKPAARMDWVSITVLAVGIGISFIVYVAGCVSLMRWMST